MNKYIIVKKSFNEYEDKYTPIWKIIEDLVILVNEKLIEGYITVGGVSVTADVASQAMILREQT